MSTAWMIDAVLWLLALLSAIAATAVEDSDKGMARGIGACAFGLAFMAIGCFIGAMCS